MSATIHALDRSLPGRAMPLRAARQAVARSVPADYTWLVDVAALAQARALFAGHCSQSSDAGMGAYRRMASGSSRASALQPSATRPRAWRQSSSDSPRRRGPVSASPRSQS
jgi:hypothetical protein